MTKPEAVVFDIGNVLIGWQPERFYDGIMSIEERKCMFSSVDLHAMNDCIDGGGAFRETIYKTAQEYPEYQKQIELWHGNWLDLASPAIDQNVEISRSLRSAGIETIILSNIGTETYKLSEQWYPFLAEFDQHFISGHMEAIKSEPSIYEMVEQNCGIPADRLLFTDDRLENIEAAQARGWQGHHFQGIEGWAKLLVDLGLLSEAQTS